MRLNRIAFIILAGCYPLSSHAVGFGNLSIASGLGQPFSATVKLLGSDVGDIQAECATARIETLAGDVIDQARVRVLNGALQIRTTGAVSEPVVRLAVGVQCDQAVSRSYDVLLDPPVTDEASMASSSRISPSTAKRPETMDATLGETSNSVTAPLTVAEQPRKLAPKAKASSETSKGKRVGADQKSPAPSRILKAENKTVSRPVLKLSADAEPLPADLMRKFVKESTPSPDKVLTDATPLSPEPSRTLFSAREAELRAEIELVRTKLALAEASITLTRLQAPPPPSLPDTTTPFLSRWLEVLSALLAASLGFSVWVILRERRRSRSLRTLAPTSFLADLDNSSDEAGKTSPYGETSSSSFFKRSSLLSRFGRPSPETRWVMDKAKQSHPIGKAIHEPASADSAAEDMATVSLQTPGVSGHLPNAHHLESQRSASDVRLEEITDVIQQVEFWISIGQSKQAISILEPLAREDRPESPIGWLYLLDLYGAVGEQAEYEKLATRFKMIFNAKIPEWSERHDTNAMRSLEDFPHLTGSICAVWNDPEKALALLKELLVDNRTGQREGFDLPAYRDIMLLMTLASERPAFA